jgi:hypothetical protein
MRKSVEFARFTLKNGVSEQTLLEKSAELQTHFLQQQEGFIKRELIKISDNQYADIVLWNDSNAAQKAMEKAYSSHSCASYFEIMEVEEDAVSHYELLATY